MSHQTDDDFDEFVSKTELKREMHALQALGERLVAYSDAQIARLDLPGELDRAVQEAKRIKSRLALGRQCQYIGKVMRKLDEVDSLKRKMDKLDNVGSEVLAELRHLECWRERLLTEGKSALTEFVSAYPEAEVQTLRQLIGKAKKEFELGNDKVIQKKLFRLLRDIHWHHENV